MALADVERHFAEQALVCEIYGSPFTGALIRALGAELGAPGPVAHLAADWAGSPRADAVALRMAGALHEAVLSGRDEALAAVYPARMPAWRMETVLPLARAHLAREADGVAAFMRSPPQTNETRRAIALLAGFLHLAARYRAPMDLLEIGASAGLNLSWDRFAYRTDSWRWGEGAVRIDTDWQAPPPPIDAAPQVRSRAACDQNPLDIRDPGERLRLKSYLWPDQADRLERFDAAVTEAIAQGVEVARADAGDWLEARLEGRPRDGLTVVYHSVFFQYPPRETRARLQAMIEAHGAAATEAAPLAWLRLEPEPLWGPKESPRFLVDVVTWPGGERKILAATDGHVRAVTTP